MTNAEKHRTARERVTAFNRFCSKFGESCNRCPARDISPKGGWDACHFIWLDLEADADDKKGK